MQWPIIPIKNLTSLFPLIFLSKHICEYALGRIKWIIDIIWPWNQHFNLKNQRNWKKQVWMLNFLIGIICILLYCWKKFTLEFLSSLLRTYLIPIHRPLNLDGQLPHPVFGVPMHGIENQVETIFRFLFIGCPPRFQLLLTPLANS